MNRGKYLIKSLFIWVSVMLLYFSFPSAFALSLSIEELEKNIEREKAHLIKMNERMRLQKLNIEKARSKERSALSELEEIEHQMQIKKRELKIYDWNLKINQEKKRMVQEKLKLTKGNIERQKNLFHSRLRAIYKQGDLTYLKAVFSASDLNDFVERYKFMYLIAKNDAKLINNFTESLKGLKESHESLKKIDSMIILYKKRALRKQKEIDSEKKKKEELLARIRDEKINYEIAQKELELASRELEDLISDLQKKKIRLNHKGIDSNIELNGLAGKKGKLPWPAKGVLLSEFGESKNPKFKAGMLSKGIEIKLPYGTNIKSIDAGRVVYSDWLKGYGNVVIIDHGKSYYSLYAHSSEPLAETGEMVTSYQIIAKSGDSGSFQGPSLYFEIRHFREPLNPLIWLKKE